MKNWNVRSASELTHYRVTRPSAYSAGTPGHKDLSARQGYYITAPNPTEAGNEIRVRLLLSMNEVLDVQDWDNGPNHGKLVATVDAYGPKKS